MDPILWIVIAVVFAAMVAAVTWFGPRSRQWKTHDGEATEEAEPFKTLPDDEEDRET